MYLINWNDSYSIGVKEIDLHHQKIITLLNMLYEDFVNDSSKNRLEKIFEELVNYTKYHFSYEEELMKNYDYVNFEMHQIMHRQFCLRLDEMQKSFRLEKRNISFNLLTFLNTWVLSHVLSTDSDMGQYISTKSNELAA